MQSAERESPSHHEWRAFRVEVIHEDSGALKEFSAMQGPVMPSVRTATIPVKIGGPRK
jgi:hypothetical protein